MVSTFMRLFGKLIIIEVVPSSVFIQLSLGTRQV